MIEQIPTGEPTPEKREKRESLLEYMEHCDKEVLIPRENLEEELRNINVRGQYLLSSVEGGLGNLALYYIDKTNNFIKARIRPWDIDEFKNLNLGDGASYFVVDKKLEELGFHRTDDIATLLARHRDEIIKKKEYEQRMADIKAEEEYEKKIKNEKKPFNF
jgi:hypothetical protein